MGIYRDQQERGFVSELGSLWAVVYKEQFAYLDAVMGWWLCVHEKLHNSRLSTPDDAHTHVLWEGADSRVRVRTASVRVGCNIVGLTCGECHWRL